MAFLAKFKKPSEADIQSKVPSEKDGAAEQSVSSKSSEKIDINMIMSNKVHSRGDDHSATANDQIPQDQQTFSESKKSSVKKKKNDMQDDFQYL